MEVRIATTLDWVRCNHRRLPKLTCTSGVGDSVIMAWMKADFLGENPHLKTQFEKKLMALTVTPQNLRNHSGYLVVPVRKSDILNRAFRFRHV